MTALADTVAALRSYPHEAFAELRARRLDDAQVPWWAVALLDLRPGTDLYRVRRSLQTGHPLSGAKASPTTPDLDAEEEWLLAWHDIVDLARRSVGSMTPRQAIAELGPARCRDAACQCIRALVQFIDLRDDDMEPWMPRDFHVSAVRMMRTASSSVILLPFAHGKSATSSLLVPLADWVENPETTQIRVYRSRDYTIQWTMKLMHVVETNAALHELTEGMVARPDPYDKSKLWTTRDGFAIAGKTVVDPSFRALTIGGSLTGMRADRTGVDDLVDRRNCTSVAVMSRYFDLMHSGVFTVERNRTGTRWRSRYETRWGNSYLVGTVFDKRDVNYRMRQEFHERELRGDKEYRTLRFGIYPRRGSRARGETLWPQKVDIEKAKELEVKLGATDFRLRCMNLPVEDGTETFPSAWIERACHDELPYGRRPPEGCHLYIGYDPAKGKRGRGLKFPAAVVLGYNPDLDLWYFLRYERWPIPMPEQVRRLIAWALELTCPVVVEGEALQESYEEWVHELTTQVQVITRPTGSTKHDKEDGVESFRPLFEADRVRFHTGGAQHETLAEFKEEWTAWPGGLYTDMVMAAWIAKYQTTLRHRAHPSITSAPIPEFVERRGYRQSVDLSRYK